MVDIPLTKIHTDNHEATRLLPQLPHNVLEYLNVSKHTWNHTDDTSTQTHINPHNDKLYGFTTFIFKYKSSCTLTFSSYVHYTLSTKI